jgi:O-acetyl-ADP-ribose deacetylase (regulator of RNase III)
MAKNNLADLTLTFVSLERSIVDEVAKAFPSTDIRYKNVGAEHKNITSCAPHDCIVSPANSFGQMDGGIDASLSRMLMKHYDVEYIGRKVRKVIAEEYFGEQPVGTCILLETDNHSFPYLAHAPTMTTPRTVTGTLNAYYAFKAVLSSVVNYNRHAHKDRKIKSILTTTFATGCGEVPLADALQQMKKAYDVVYEGIEPTWGGAGILVTELNGLLL